MFYIRVYDSGSPTINIELCKVVLMHLHPSVCICLGCGLHVCVCVCGAMRGGQGEGCRGGERRGATFMGFAVII